MLLTIIGLLAAIALGHGGPAPASRVSASLESPVAGDEAAPAPIFSGSIHVIDPPTRLRLRHSWNSTCPVHIGDLRLVDVSYITPSGVVARGELIVNRVVAAETVAIFEDLFAARFPITQIRLIDAFGGDDNRSMRANNSSGFNCRRVAGSTAWSQHAYGLAIDVNPLVNPWVRATGVIPIAGSKYADRSIDAAGMIHDRDAAVVAFESAGWSWGGGWAHSKDYQHFSTGER